MPLIPHQFEESGHIYKVQGNYVLSTSDVIALNGLSLLQGVPSETLAWASARGTMVHDAIHCLEEGRELPELTEEASVRVEAYKRWKLNVGFRVCGPMERSIVYQHQGTDVLIGGTPDVIGKVQKQVYVIDVKTCFRQSGKAKLQKMLEWRLQTQSYLEGLAEDEQLWKKITGMKRAILHLHPECGIVERGEPRLGYDFHVFDTDDSLIWDSAVRMAMTKISNGHALPDRRQEPSVFGKTNAAPEEEMECIF